MASAVLNSQKDVADSLGIAERTFATWLKEGCPGEPRNYVVCDIVLWARENKWGDGDGALIDSVQDGELKDELIQQRIEKLKRENQLADLKIHERNESLVDVHEVEDVFVRSSALFRDGLERLERRCGSEAREIVEEVLDEVDRQLERGCFDRSESTSPA